MQTYKCLLKDYSLRHQLCFLHEMQSGVQIFCEGVKVLNSDYFCEMDTVLSAKGSNKCILTFYIPETELFIARLLNRCTEDAVRAAIDEMEKALGTYDFLTVFHTCLTDRGSEFGDPVSLETGINGIQRMSIYYCDPMRSNQKGGIEEAHTLLRMIIPKEDNKLLII